MEYEVSKKDFKYNHAKDKIKKETKEIGGNLWTLGRLATGGFIFAGEEQKETWVMESRRRSPGGSIFSGEEQKGTGGDGASDGRDRWICFSR
ncbi:hypothetical protein RJ640_000079 [Escallonia rubra]|uniref:Uncharacterized protein n=1 Tax=Escallonia rubra TaxID=112253 RepID=A0AA88QQA1_9ASTE|nr:hypothetical protein RJ640_000079 [Escallonia rubra]